ncbi:MAG: ATP-binding protein [Anaerolineales bacterium]|nr:ATP-binding protein [Anaerolineales bacterium]
MNANLIRVLLIEDDPDDALLLKESLAEANAIRVKLTHADHLSEGLQRIAEQEFDVVLLDLNLPDSRGLDTLNLLLRQVAATPVVVLSGLADDETTLEAVKMGAQDYLVKGEINGPMLGRVLHYAIERKRAEAMLKSSEDDLNRAQSVAHIGSWKLDIPRNVLQWSDETYRIFGIERGAALTYQIFLDHVHPDDRENVNRAWQIALEGAEYNIEHRIITRQGIGWVNERAVIDFDRLGNAILGTGTVQDITQRKQVEAEILALNASLEQRVALRTAELEESNRELQKAKEAAEQANRAKTEFLSRMSHELRTPLNAVLGFAQVLEMTSLNERQKTDIGHIHTAGKHLLDLINEVLDIARVEGGRLSISLESVALYDLVSETLDLIQPLAKQRGIQIASVQIAEQTVKADRQRLRQVLLNLLGNAIKYNREQGTVTLTCEARPENYLRLNVRDTGPGIAANMLERAFTPFDRLGAEKKAEVEGTGLGLALSKRLVEAMGGAIGVESVVGEGSVFWIELPEIKK